MAAPLVSSAPQGAFDRIKTLVPGLALSLAIAVLAIVVRNATGIAALNPVVVALVVGMGFHAIWGTPAVLKPGIGFAVRPVLRAAIVLLGLQVTLGMLWSLGPAALLLAVVVVAATLPFTMWLGHVLGVDRALAQLIGTGTAICGASAIVAANQVARGREEDVTYALAVITLCGTAAMILFPYLAGPLGLDAQDYGIWAGGAIHEVVQAVGAAAAGGPVSSQTGTVMKLARVFMLAPAVLALGWWVARQSGGEAAGVKAPVPVFAFGFLGLVLLGSTGLVPQAAVDASRFLVPLMLAASVAALGLQTNLKALKARGLAPLLLGVASSLFIAALAYVGVRLIG
ncbi:YeiH family protein [Rhodovarius lipocyclicus]|uniref:YeiH family protein n=1 Tax=Rhodovarius lipocyclicus TaxID=268410 RepID=UPI0013580315|nr:putative sulfate exporter family transporter [Rhodovarius lipocyclicus]